MRNLIKILLKYYFIIFFIILETISFSVYINNNQNHKETVLSSTNSVVAYFYRLNSYVFEYLNLRKINSQLSNENVELRNQIKSSFSDNSITLLNIYDSVYTQKYFFINAKVISNSINKQQNYLTLNKGKRQGIRSEMGVVSPTGIVGIVKDVSSRYASVISILNTKLSISAKIKRNGYFGSLIWEGKDYKHMFLKEIPNLVEMFVGDTICTSGYSAIFPEGQTIGVISDFIKNNKNNFATIEVELTTDFKNITYVYVVENYNKLEQKQLEENSSND